MCFYVYIIYNERSDKFYIGQTNDLERRLFEHNNHLSKYTSKYDGSWSLIYKESCVSRSEAMAREKFLKKQKNKSFYRKISSDNTR